MTQTVNSSSAGYTDNAVRDDQGSSAKCVKGCLVGVCCELYSVVTDSILRSAVFRVI